MRGHISRKDKISIKALDIDEVFGYGSDIVSRTPKVLRKIKRVYE